MHTRAKKDSGAVARRHDVKESNPLDGSFGGSPVAVTYVVSRLPRGAVILRFLDARVNLLVHSFFSLRLFLGAAGGGRTRDQLGMGNRPLPAQEGKLPETVCQVLYQAELQRRSGAGGSRTRYLPSENR